jgi:hypothetical protein
MDFGFLRASSDNYKQPNNALDRAITSYDGYCAYLLIVDSASRRVWAFLTASKEPPSKYSAPSCVNLASTMG